MPAGQYRHPVVADAPSDSAPSGWSAQGTLWTAITPTGGTELFRGRQLEASVTHLITMRRSSLSARILPTWRLRYGDRLFYLRSVINVGERGQEIECQAIETPEVS